MEDQSSGGSRSGGPSLGEIGVWRRGPDLDPDLAQHLEDLGFGALWVGSSPAADLEHVEGLIAATRGIVVATGIVNIVKDAYTRLAQASGLRP